MIVDSNTESKYRADIAYIGTEYNGYQSQQNGDSIQDRIEAAFSKFLRHPVRVRGASRTDAGVHAENQVLCFRSAVHFKESEWQYSANAILPKAIAVTHFSKVADDFDPINDSTGKIYRYRLWRGHCTFPFVRDFVWTVPREIDVEILTREINSFVGKHDFTSFCSADSDAATRVREIFQVKVEVRDHLVDIWILGGGFLKQMVRIIVGTLVDIALGKKPEGAIPQIIAQKRRGAAGQTAPPQGLTLVKILYGEKPDLELVIKDASRGYCLKV